MRFSAILVQTALARLPLSRCSVGLLKPSGGHISFHGRKVRENLNAFQRRIGYIPEEPHLYAHLSGREYLQLVGRLRGLKRFSVQLARAWGR